MTTTTEASTAVAVRDPELDRFARLGQWLAAAEGSKDPKGAGGMAAAYRIAAAAAMGLPWRAAGELHLFDGKIQVSALLLRALAEDAGYRVERLAAVSDDTTCTVVLYRGGDEIGRSTFTMEDARRAGLAGKHNYKTYPQRMLWARAATNVIRDYAPAIAVGLVTPDELDRGDVVDGEAVDLAPDIEFPVLDQTSEYEARQEVAELPEHEQAIVDALTEELGAAPPNEGGDPPDNA